MARSSTFTECLSSKRQQVAGRSAKIPGNGPSSAPGGTHPPERSGSVPKRLEQALPLSLITSPNVRKPPPVNHHRIGRDGRFRPTFGHGRNGLFDAEPRTAAEAAGERRFPDYRPTMLSISRSKDLLSRDAAQVRLT